MKILALFVLLLAQSQASSLPLLCLSTPPLQLEAGVSVLSASIDNPFGRRCAASLRFSDPDFLPILYTFDTIRCSGPQSASFLVPAGAPSGEAYVTWFCAGQTPACNRAFITSGQGDTSMSLEATGTVGCVSQIVQTQSTFVTLTSSQTTLTVPTLTTLTTTTTSFPSPDVDATDVASSDHWQTSATTPTFDTDTVSKTASETVIETGVSSTNVVFPATPTTPGGAEQTEDSTTTTTSILTITVATCTSSGASSASV